MKENNELEFEVLSDVGNMLARGLVIIFRQPASMRTLFQEFGVDLKTMNGDNSLIVTV